MSAAYIMIPLFWLARNGATSTVLFFSLPFLGRFVYWGESLEWERVMRTMFWVKILLLFGGVLFSIIITILTAWVGRSVFLLTTALIPIAIFAVIGLGRKCGMCGSHLTYAKKTYESVAWGHGTRRVARFHVFCTRCEMTTII